MSSVKRKRAQFWADKTMDLANLSAIVLVFGQLTESRINFAVLLFGIMIYISFVIFSNNLTR